MGANLSTLGHEDISGSCDIIDHVTR